MKNKSARKILENTSEETKQKVRDWADQQIKKAMKLIKINTYHFIVVDNSEIKEGDWLYSFDNSLIVQANRVSADTINSKSLNGRGYGKITHSTQPFNNRPHFAQYGLITLSEVKELIGEVDVKKKAAELAYSRRIRFGDDFNSGVCDGLEEGYELGYNQALEDNKEKKYTEKEVFNAIGVAIGLWSSTYSSFEEGWKLRILQSLQPKTEWEVEFVDGKLKIKK